MKSFKKEFLALVLLVALVASFFVVTGTDGEADADDEHSHEGWIKWTSNNSLPSTPGSYYLDKDVTLTETWTVIVNINLCLNGHSIVMNQDNSSTNTSVISVTSNEGITSKGVLNLYDCNPSGKPNGITHAEGAKGSGVTVTRYGIFTMYGGTIFGNSSTDNGGGVAVIGGFQKAYFYMKGGTIVKNSCTSHGGGVLTSGATEFEMDGGTITSNTSNKGGGVYCTRSFTLKDGILSGNESTSDGGGIYLCAYGDFTMSGGTIEKNGSGNCGGGICMENNVNFKMTGDNCLITGNTSSAQGAGVCIWNGFFTMSAGEIAGNKTSNDGGGVYIAGSGTFKISGGKISGNVSGTGHYGGGGIYHYGTLEIKGNPVVKDNRAGSADSNVKVIGSRTIKVTAPISSTVPSVGITDTNIASAFTSSYSGSAPYLFFFSDDSNKRVILSGTEAALTSVSLSLSLDQTSFTYDGTAKIPTATVKDGNTTLTLGTQYTLSYLRGGAVTTDFTSAGTITVKAVGAGEYIGKTISKNYTISQASATVTADDKEKDKWEADPEFTATVIGLIGSDTISYTISREAGEEVGEYAIMPAGETSQGNYKVTYVPGTLIINGLLTVTFDVQGHGDAPDAQYVGYGKKVSEPKEPIAYGWKFGGWFKDSKCTSEWDFSYDTVQEDTVLYAKWTYVHYEDDDDEEVQAYLQRIAHIRAMQEAQQTENYSEQETVMVTIAAGAVAAALLAVVIMLFRRY